MLAIGDHFAERFVLERQRLYEIGRGLAVLVVLKKARLRD